MCVCVARFYSFSLIVDSHAVYPVSQQGNINVPNNFDENIWPVSRPKIQTRKYTGLHY